MTDSARNGSALPWNYFGGYTLKHGNGTATIVIQIFNLRWHHRSLGRLLAFYALWRIVRYG